MSPDNKLLWPESFRCPHCNGRLYAAGFNGEPFCWECYCYVEPVRRGKKSDYIYKEVHK